jgi:hypothetical protein
MTTARTVIDFPEAHVAPPQPATGGKGPASATERTPQRRQIAMSGKPALIRERELNKAMNVARKAGAKEIRVHLGDNVSIVIPLESDDDKSVESEQQITL